MLEVSLQETDEDHLGVTLIRSGDSVIIRMRLFPFGGEVNLGGTTVIMLIVPGIAVMQYRGFLHAKQGKTKKEGKKNENYIKRRLRKRV